MARALRKHLGEVVWCNPSPNAPKGLGARIRERMKGRSSAVARLGPSHAYSRLVAEKIHAFLRADSFDAVFCPNGAHVIPYLDTPLPVIYTSDATRRLLDGYALWTQDSSEAYRRELDELETMALSRMDLAIACTQWVARSMIEDYGVPSGRVAVVNSGGSLDWVPPAEQVTRKRMDGACRLLLVGMNWEGKGCDIAVEVHRALRKMGVPSELTICGCLPPRPLHEEGLTVLPRQDKRKYLQRRRIYRLYAESHLFLLPTRAECFGLSICEANANGLPAIVPRTGGVPEAVRDGVNGYVIPYDAPPEAYAEKIAEIWADPGLYHRLVQASREEYDTRLNWDVWGERVAGLVKDVLQRHVQRSRR